MPAPPLEPRSLVKLKIAAVLVVVVVFAVAHRSGIFHQFADPARVARTLVQLGPWGYVAFVATYAALQPFGVPGTVFVFAAPLIWPWPVAYALSMTGTMAASVIGFSFSRFVARDWVSKVIPPRFRRYEDALAARAFTTVFVLRLVFWMPPLLHAFFGVSKVPFRVHFWGSLAGYIVPLFLVSFFGQKLFDAVKDAPPKFWIGLAGVMVVMALASWAVRRSKKSSGGS
jgi:uncharacterized membrane protein YdjX (TVP38/TMEM64 family)